MLNGRRVHHSVAAGDVVLAIPPPYLLDPWMGAGIPLIASILERDGIVPRVVRLLDDLHDTPAEILDACELTEWGTRPLDERAAAMRAAAERHAGFFDGQLAILLAGPENVFGFSVYRHNADVAIELARRLKERKPGCLIVVGGPEAAECPANLACEWIDLVVGAGAEGLVTLAMRACLEGRPEEMAAWQQTWVNPRHRPRVHLSRRQAEIPPIPPIDYSRLLPLFLGDPEPTVPVLLNVGCPFRCGFCTNTTIYPEMMWSAPEKLAAEMHHVVEGWAALSDAPLRLAMCDATVNAQPAQFEELCRLMIAQPWQRRPTVEGLFLVDGRVTPEHVDLFSRAGFNQIYFGLESASHSVRRAMKKPGPIASVMKGIENIRAHGERRVGVSFGIIAGWPTETEEHFQETIGFVEWAATLGVVDTVNVLPLHRTPGAMDPELFAGAEGMGLVWRMDAPAGAPSVRCRRYLSVFEHFHGALEIESGLSRRLAVELMLPGAPPAVYEPWHRLHGDANDFKKHKPKPEEAAPRAPAAEAVEYAAGVERLLAPALAVGGTLGAWTLAAIEPSLDDRESAVLKFSSGGADGARLMVVEVRPRSESRQAFSKTARFDVVYLNQYEDRSCVVDRAALEAIVAAIAGGERGSGADAEARP